MIQSAVKWASLMERGFTYTHSLQYDEGTVIHYWHKENGDDDIYISCYEYTAYNMVGCCTEYTVPKKYAGENQWWLKKA